MNFFGIGKLWSWVVVGVSALALLGAAYLLIYKKGEAAANLQTQTQNVEKVDNARKADEKATETIIREYHTIETRTNQVKESIREVPDTGLNAVSRARLERVREQQAASGQEPDRASGNSTELSNGTDSTNH